MYSPWSVISSVDADRANARIAHAGLEVEVFHQGRAVDAGVDGGLGADGLTVQAVLYIRARGRGNGGQITGAVLDQAGAADGVARLARLVAADGGDIGDIEAGLRYQS